VRISDDKATPIAEAKISGDSLAHKVAFAAAAGGNSGGGKSLRDVAPDGMAQLRFTVGEGGALYSFTAGSAPAPAAASAEGR
jgi:hypothetical protein